MSEKKGSYTSFPPGISKGMKPRWGNRYASKLFPASKVNLDLSHRCPLECPRCSRQIHWRDKGLRVPGRDITIEEFEKIVDYFDRIQFCGQYSDPIHHPHFIDFLKMIRDKKKISQVHNASTHKPDSFFIKAWEANPETQWWFGIDGLPKDSHKYRVHQDGELHFKRAIMSKKYLKKKPIWQMIVFNYNQNSIKECVKLAEDNGIVFNLINSGRWLGPDDRLMPKNRIESRGDYAETWDPKDNNLVGSAPDDIMNANPDGSRYQHPTLKDGSDYLGLPEHIKRDDLKKRKNDRD
jgi:MoaA/NifB/PqqE/SkfB family radical SAM enzyme